jgi:protein O-GlcNAc transferase
LNLEIFNAAVQAHQLGDIARAEQLYLEALRRQPMNADAFANLALILMDRGDLISAHQSISQSLAIDSRPAAYWSLLGQIASKKGDYSAATTAYLQAVRLSPMDPQLHYLLGCSLHEQSDRASAILAYRRALEIKPGDPDVSNNLGIALQETGQLDKAIQAFRVALQYQPENISVWTNLGIALQNHGQFEQSLAALQQSLRLAPNHVPSMLAMGNWFLERGNLQDAGKTFSKIIQLDPKHSEAHYNLGLIYHTLGKRDLAAQAYQRAATLSPKYSLLLAIHQTQQLAILDGAERQAREALDELSMAQQNGTITPVPPFVIMTLPIESSAQEQWDCARYWSQSTYRFVPRIKVPMRPEKDRIRLGYISPDFRAHPGAMLVAELIEAHNRQRFEVFIYSLAPPDDSVFQQRIIRGSDHFIDLRSDSIETAASRVFGDEIDILVDISGYSQYSRAEILAAHPAAVQVNYLGFPGTMGADFIDYILVDDFIVPNDQQSYFSERLVHLPGCYQVNASRWQLGPEVTRAQVGLPEEAFVFCAFNNPYKITETMFRLWMRLLDKIPRSVLWVLETNAAAAENLRQSAMKLGVNPKRLCFAPKRPLPEHLVRHKLADLFLDCYPVNAHTTASDALRVGLPLITLSGKTFISRVAGSLLQTVGLPELITYDFASYETLACELASQPSRLTEIRYRLSENVKTSSLFNIQAATKKIETAYDYMYARYRSGKMPKPFRINEQYKVESK